MMVRASCVSYIEGLEVSEQSHEVKQLDPLLLVNGTEFRRDWRDCFGSLGGTHAPTTAGGFGRGWYLAAELVGNRAAIVIDKRDHGDASSLTAHAQEAEQLHDAPQSILVGCPGKDEEATRRGEEDR